MALGGINLSDNFLNSASKANFNLSDDAERYKKLIDPSELITKGYTLSSDLLKSILANVSGDISLLNGTNKSEINNIIVKALNKNMGVGGSSIKTRNSVSNGLNTVCGNFDSSLFNKYGSMNLGLSSLGSLSLLTALLCMGVTNSVSLLHGNITKNGTPNGLLVGVVSDTLSTLGFNFKSNGKLSNSFSPTKSKSLSTNIDTNAILADITSNAELIKVFKGTDVSSKLLNSYKTTTNDVNITKYADELMPSWSKVGLSSTNVSNAFAKVGTSTKIDSITSFASNGISKSNIMSLFG